MKSEIFGCEQNERQGSKIPIASFQLALTYSALVIIGGRSQACLVQSELYVGWMAWMDGWMDGMVIIGRL